MAGQRSIAVAGIFLTLILIISIFSAPLGSAQEEPSAHAVTIKNSYIDGQFVEEYIGNDFTGTSENLDGGSSISLGSYIEDAIIQNSKISNSNILRSIIIDSITLDSSIKEFILVNKDYSGVNLTVTTDMHVGPLSPRAIVAPEETFRICYSNTLCTFDGSKSYDPDGEIVEYRWDFSIVLFSGNTDIELVEAQKHILTEFGEIISVIFPDPDPSENNVVYTVTLTVTDNDGNIGKSNMIFIIVYQNNAPVAGAGPDKECLGNALCILDGSNSYDPDGFIASWEWDFGDGSTGTGETVSHTFLGPKKKIDKTPSEDIGPADLPVYDVTLTVTDNLGAIGLDNVLIYIIPDIDPPSISVSHSPEEPTDKDEIIIIATASDNAGISQIFIYVNGLLSATCPSSPCTYTASYSPGTYTYYATAIDPSGNVGDSPTNSFTVIDTTTPPTVSVFSNHALPTETDEVTITAIATDNTGGVEKIEVYVDDVLKSTCFLTTSCSIPAQTYPAGTHTYWANASDSYGNTGRDPATETKSFRVYDIIPPTITLIYHQPPSPTTLTPVIVGAKATDNNGIGHIDIYVREYPHSTYVAFKSCPSSPCETDEKTYPEGTYIYWVTAYDTSGNAKHAPPAGKVNTFTVTVADSPLSPTVSIYSCADSACLIPKSEFEASKPVHFMATATSVNELDKIEIYINNTVNPAEICDVSGTSATCYYSITSGFILDNPTVPETHSYFAKTYDVAGNFGTATGNFTVIQPFYLTGTTTTATGIKTGQEVNLTWGWNIQLPGTNAKHYKTTLYKKSTAGEIIPGQWHWAKVAEVSPPATSYVHKHLDENTSYDFMAEAGISYTKPDGDVGYATYQSNVFTIKTGADISPIVTAWHKSDLREYWSSGINYADEILVFSAAARDNAAIMDISLFVNDYLKCHKEYWNDPYNAPASDTCSWETKAVDTDYEYYACVTDNNLHKVCTEVYSVPVERPYSGDADIILLTDYQIKPGPPDYEPTKYQFKQYRFGACTLNANEQLICEVGGSAYKSYTPGIKMDPPAIGTGGAFINIGDEKNPLDTYPVGVVYETSSPGNPREGPYFLVGKKPANFMYPPAFFDPTFSKEPTGFEYSGRMSGAGIAFGDLNGDGVLNDMIVAKGVQTSNMNFEDEYVEIRLDAGSSCSINADGFLYCNDVEGKDLSITLPFQGVDAGTDVTIGELGGDSKKPEVVVVYAVDTGDSMEALSGIITLISLFTDIVGWVVTLGGNSVIKIVVQFGESVGTYVMEYGITEWLKSFNGVAFGAIVGKDCSIANAKLNCDWGDPTIILNDNSVKEVSEIGVAVHNFGVGNIFGAEKPEVIIAMVDTTNSNTNSPAGDLKYFAGTDCYIEDIIALDGTKFKGVLACIDWGPFYSISGDDKTSLNVAIMATNTAKSQSDSNLPSDTKLIMTDDVSSIELSDGRSYTIIDISSIELIGGSSIKIKDMVGFKFTDGQITDVETQNGDYTPVADISSIKHINGSSIEIKDIAIFKLSDGELVTIGL